MWHFELTRSHFLQIRTEGLMGTFHAVLVRGINEAMYTLQQCPSMVEP